MRRVTSAVLMLCFSAVPPATVVAETTVAEAMVVVLPPSPVAACAMQDDGWEMTDECMEYIGGAFLACVVAGALSLGSACWAAIYFAVAGCTCLSAWGSYDYLTRFVVWESCMMFVGFNQGNSSACGPPPDWNIALDDTEDCQGDGYDNNPS